jgi:hypothetical protein
MTLHSKGKLLALHSNIRIVTDCDKHMKLLPYQSITVIKFFIAQAHGLKTFTVDNQRQGVELGQGTPPPHPYNHFHNEAICQFQMGIKIRLG